MRIVGERISSISCEMSSWRLDLQRDWYCVCCTADLSFCFSGVNLDMVFHFPDLFKCEAGPCPTVRIWEQKMYFLLHWKKPVRDAIVLGPVQAQWFFSLCIEIRYKDKREREIKRLYLEIALDVWIPATWLFCLRDRVAFPGSGSKQRDDRIQRSVAPKWKLHCLSY